MYCKFSTYKLSRQIRCLEGFSKLLNAWFQVLYAQDVDQRSATFKKALEMGEEYQRRAK